MAAPSFLPPVATPTKVVHLNFTQENVEEGSGVGRTRSADISRDGAALHVEALLASHNSPLKSIEEDNLDPFGSGRKFFSYSSAVDASTRPSVSEQLDIIKSLILSFYDPDVIPTGNYMYIIDATWMRHWIDYVLYEEKGSSQMKSQRPSPKVPG